MRAITVYTADHDYRQLRISDIVSVVDAGIRPDYGYAIMTTGRTVRFGRPGEDKYVKRELSEYGGD